MYFLLIDSSQDTSHLALFQGHAILQHIESKDLSQSNFLLPTINNLLKNYNLTLKNLKAIAICIGPGSFTGTRIGVMTAKTLSYATKIPLIPFYSLLGYTDHLHKPLIAAKRGSYFTLDDNNSPKLLTQSELDETSSPFLSPNKAPILEKSPNIDVQESPYLLSNIAKFILEKISLMDFEDPMKLDVCYLQSPIST